MRSQGKGTHPLTSEKSQRSSQRPVLTRLGSLGNEMGKCSVIFMTLIVSTHVRHLYFGSLRPVLLRFLVGCAFCNVGAS